VIVALFLVDVAAVVICQTQNDALAKHCARAGADQPTLAQATNAMNDVTAQFQTQNNSSKICQFVGYVPNYNTGSATCYVQTTVTCWFPVPIPFGPSSMNFVADCIEPITATLP